MPVTIIIGAQWGDEGKGRFVDYFSGKSQIVARYSGGDNAGHTVAVKGEVFKMHLIPSGIIHEGVIAVLGNGMVINPISLIKEMNRLSEQGVNITPENLYISSAAHIITPAHIQLDKLKEIQRGDEAIGTTLKGIGPAYLDKIGRHGLRVSQMLDVENYADALAKSMEEHNETLGAAGANLVDIGVSVQQYIDAAETLRPFIRNTAIYLNQELKKGARIVCEGAQGTLLDVDHGSYPFVTSSNPTVGGVLTGLGVGPTSIDRVIGVAKAFSTRVGEGAMPTEDLGEIGNRLRGTGENYWDEYGTTTGRSRRCGWLDTVMLRYSTAINGFTEMMLTKLDTLSGFDELKIAVAYEIDGERLAYPPNTAAELERAIPIYETMSGWQEDVSEARTAQDLPKSALAYINRTVELCGVPINVVSVGPERHQVVSL